MGFMLICLVERENKMSTQDELSVILRDYVSQFRTKTEAAEALGITLPYLSDILRGNRLISDTVAQKLGYRKETTYRRIKD
jgi:predicted XRE-type DNA-binding protein